MSLNNMGVGFNFTGRDTGLGKTIASAKAGFTGLAGAVQGAVKGVGQFSFAALTNKTNVAEASADMHMNTNAIQDFGVAADQAASKVFAGMSHMSMGMKKAKSMVMNLAYSLNREGNVGDIAESLKAIEQSGVKLDKIGFKNFEQFTKFAEVSSLDTKQFAATMAHLKNEVGFTDSDLADLNKTTVALGTRFNMGSEAMGNMLQMTKLMQDESQGLFITWRKDKTRQFLESGTALAGLFIKAGHTSEEANQLAQGLTRAVVQGVNNFQSIYSGLESDLGPMATALSENLGGVQDSFELLQKSPLEFAQALNKAFVQIEKSGKIAPKQLQAAFARFSQQLSGSTNPAITDFITHGLTPLQGEISQVQSDMKKGLAGRDGAILHVSNGFRTGLTAAQEYDRILVQMDHSLRGLGDVNDRKFNKSLRTTTRLMSHNIAATKKEYKGFGKFFDAFEEINAHGFGAFIGGLTKSGVATQALTKHMGPAGAAVTSLFLMFRDAAKAGKNATSEFSPMKEKLGAFAQGVGDFAKDMVAGFKVLWPQIKDAGGQAVQTLYEAITGEKTHSPKEAFDKIWSGAFAYLRNAIPRWWDGIKRMLLGLYNGLAGDGRQAATLSEAFVKIWSVIAPKIKLFFTGMLRDLFLSLATMTKDIPLLGGMFQKGTIALGNSMLSQVDAMNKENARVAAKAKADNDFYNSHQAELSSFNQPMGFGATPQDLGAVPGRKRARLLADLPDMNTQKNDQAVQERHNEQMDVLKDIRDNTEQQRQQQKTANTRPSGIPVGTGVGTAQ